MYSLSASPTDIYKNRDVEVQNITNAERALDEAKKLLNRERDGRRVYAKVRLTAPTLGLDLLLSLN